MAKIWTDDDEIEVDGMDVGEMEAAMRFKARHIRAKADPELFENVADALVMLWEEAKNRMPVVHGRWVDNMCRDWRCSECGEKINKVRNVDGYCYDDKPNYCPNCGARMDGGE